MAVDDVSKENLIEPNSELCTSRQLILRIWESLYLNENFESYIKFRKTARSEVHVKNPQELNILGTVRYTDAWIVRFGTRRYAISLGEMKGVDPPIGKGSAWDISAIEIFNEIMSEELELLLLESFRDNYDFNNSLIIAFEDGTFSVNSTSQFGPRIPDFIEFELHKYAFLLADKDETYITGPSKVMYRRELQPVLLELICSILSTISTVEPLF